MFVDLPEEKLLDCQAHASGPVEFLLEASRGKEVGSREAEDGYIWRAHSSPL